MAKTETHSYFRSTTLLVVVSGLLCYQNCGKSQDSRVSTPTATETQTAASESADGFILSEEAVQTEYQNGTPHIAKDGRRLTEFREGTSFFPIWAYGVRHPATPYICHPDGRKKKWIETASQDSARYSNARLLKEAHFTAGQYIGLPEYSQVFLDEMSRQDLQALFYWYPLDTGLDGRHWESWSGYSTPKDFIAKNAENPHVLGWIPTEETGRYVGRADRTLESWIQFYHSLIAEIRTLTPKPVFILDNLWVSEQTEKSLQDGDVEAWTYFHQTDSIAALDNYISHLKTVTTLDVPNGVAGAGRFIARAYEGQRPFWPMINVYEEYDAKGAIVEGNEFPSPQQLKGLIYASIVHGATGIGYFGLDDYSLRRARMLGVRADTPEAYLTDPAIDYGACDPQTFSMLAVSPAKAKESAELWKAIAQLNAEITDLAPAILSKTSTELYFVGLNGPAVSRTPIRTLLKSLDGQLYLFAVNLDRASLKARFDFPNLKGTFQIEVVGENRNYRTAGSEVAWTDDFSEFGVHVYRFLK